MKLEIVSIHIKDSPQAMPLAAGMLAARLKAENLPGFELSFSDFYAHQKASELVKTLLAKAPEALGFSTYLWNRKLVSEAAAAIKSAAPHIILFAGGAEASADPGRLLDEVPFDFIVTGEGEHALTGAVKRLLEGRGLEGLPGILTKDGNGQMEPFPVMDLEALPSPFLTGALKPQNYPGVLWELSRGCPFKCDFCFESRGVEGVRRYPFERLEAELELFEAFQVTQVFVLDPTFNCDKLRAKRILSLILEKAPHIHFTFEVRTEFLDGEMAELFSSINCSLQIGLQSSDPKVLSLVNRRIDPELYAEKIGLLNESGVIFGLDLIYGLPGDSLEGFKGSLDYAVNLQPNNLDIFPLAVLPGTALYEKSDSLKLNFDRRAPYKVISTPSFGEEDLNEAGKLAEACDLFYNRGGAVGWLYMVLETLEVSPSLFFTEFRDWLTFEKKKAPEARLEIGEFQKFFVSRLFRKHGKEALIPPMEDLITFHTALDYSLYAGPAEPAEKPLNGDTIFSKAPGTLCRTLRYDPDDLSAIGEIRLEEFVMGYNPAETSVILYNYYGEVKFITNPPGWLKLLTEVGEENTAEELLLNNPDLSRDELMEILKWAVGETILLTQ